ncbi:CBS domain-containing protein [Sorangium sp. So ce131]|uniref:CBS domain-containing protein n=1 Tax=Sorangium sp. So ce131 TaxID=3133282 RepID=UPI003F645B1C
MSSEMTDGEHPTPRQPIRSAHIVGPGGGVSMVATVYCPVQERSAALTECQACQRFHALHAEAGARATSVVCQPGQAAADGSAASAAREDGGLLRDMDRPLDPEAPLAEVMTRNVICVRPDVDLDQIVALLVRHGINGMPVVDEAGKPVGMVSRADVLRAAQERGDTAEAARVTARLGDGALLEIEPGLRVLEPVQITASDVMTPVVVKLHESASIRQAAALMAYEGVHRLPIVSDDGKVVGILSSLDVLRWFARRCGYLIPPGRRRA